MSLVDRDFVGHSDEDKGLSVMGQDARSPGVVLGLLCKHMARNKAQSGLGVGACVSG